jgi:hypothetical protein
MKGLIPFGSLTIAAGAATQALATTAALFALWDDSPGANGPAGTVDDGDVSVKPDYANNRILVASPGVYEVEVILSGAIDAAADVTMNVAKNGTAVADLLTKSRWTNAVKNVQTVKGFISVTAADNPGTIATQAEPAGTFTGGGGYPKRMVPLTLLVASGAGTPTITAENAQFIVKRVG